MNVFNLPRVFSVAMYVIAASASLAAQSVDELLQKGDVYDKQFRPTQALEYYLPAEKLQPKNVRVLTSVARQYRHLMADANSRTEKLRLGRLALSYSERAAAAAPNDSEAQLSTGISLGKMLPIMETKEQVAASPRIKYSAEKALKLDPRNDLAWHILGRWHRVIADISPLKRAVAPLIYGKLPEGSIKDAEDCLKKAVQLNPNRLIHHIELGRVYAQMGRAEEARRHINKGLAMTASEKDDVEAKARGREDLAKLR